MITHTNRKQQMRRLSEQLVAAVSEVDIAQLRNRWGKRKSSPLVGEEGTALYAALATIAQKRGIWLTHRCPPGFKGVNGLYLHLDRLIYVKRQSQLHMTKTLAHELAHALDEERGTPGAEAETVAEAVAYLVLASFGLDSSTFSAPYIAVYTRNEPDLLLRCLPRIQRLALVIIERASAHLAPAAAQPDPWDHALTLVQASAPGC